MGTIGTSSTNNAANDTGQGTPTWQSWSGLSLGLNTPALSAGANVLTDLQQAGSWDPLVMAFER